MVCCIVWYAVLYGMLYCMVCCIVWSGVLYGLGYGMVYGIFWYGVLYGIRHRMIWYYIILVYNPESLHYFRAEQTMPSTLDHSAKRLGYIHIQIDIYLYEYINIQTRKILL